MPEISKYLAKISQKNTIAKDVLELQLDKPDKFEYQSGQFAQFMIPDGDKTSPRSYSISSTPDCDYLEFCIKLVPGGLCSEYIKDVKVGDEIEIHGPRGRFVLSSTSAPLYFVATGAGLAPIISMIEDELKNKENKNKITLLFGVRSEEDIFWQERLQKLVDNFENFSCTITLSQPSDSWAGESGRVTEHLSEVDADQHVSLCGNKEMVKEVREILLEKKVDPSRIHFEIF